MSLLYFDSNTFIDHISEADIHALYKASGLHLENDIRHARSQLGQLWTCISHVKQADIPKNSQPVTTLCTWPAELYHDGQNDSGEDISPENLISMAGKHRQGCFVAKQGSDPKHGFT